MLKITRAANGEVVLTVSGRLDAANLDELKTLKNSEANSRRIVLDLKDLTLVDQDAVSFLERCEADNITLKNCPAYVREWITGERKDKRQEHVRRFFWCVALLLPASYKPISHFDLLWHGPCQYYLQKEKRRRRENSNEDRHIIFHGPASYLDESVGSDSNSRFRVSPPLDRDRMAERYYKDRNKVSSQSAKAQVGRPRFSQLGTENL